MSISQFEAADITLVSFDLWHTIIDTNQEFNEKRIALFFNALIKERDVPIAEESFRKIFSQQKKVSEKQSEEEQRHIDFEERMIAIQQALAIPPLSAEVLASLDQQHRDLAYQFPPTLMHTDIKQLFTDIVASGKEMAIISNTGLVDSSAARNALHVHDLDQYITHHLYSDKAGLTKPHPRIFEMLIDQSERQPHEILHIGDNYTTDYEGPQRAGFRSMHTPLDNEGIKAVREALILN